MKLKKHAVAGTATGARDGTAAVYVTKPVIQMANLQATNGDHSANLGA